MHNIHDSGTVHIKCGSSFPPLPGPPHPLPHPLLPKPLWCSQKAEVKCCVTYFDLSAQRASRRFTTADSLSSRPPLFQQLTSKLIFWRVTDGRGCMYGGEAARREEKGEEASFRQCQQKSVEMKWRASSTGAGQNRGNPTGQHAAGSVVKLSPSWNTTLCY